MSHTVLVVEDDVELCEMMCKALELSGYTVVTAQDGKDALNKVSGIDKTKLEGWSRKAGWEALLNKAGTTFRKLPDKDKEALTEKKALALMQAQPSIIKRPVLETGGKLLVGFKPEVYAAAFPR